MVQRVYHGDHSRASGNEYPKLVDDYRKTLVQIIGGAFLLYTVSLTQRRTKAAEETLRTTQKGMEITRETQVTDRFTKAIGQLGAIRVKAVAEGHVYAVTNNRYVSCWILLL